MKVLSILVADDHAVVLHGLRAVLEVNTGWKIVAEAKEGREAVAKACDLQPDLAIVDVSMPLLNGLEAAREIARCSPRTRVLILTMYGSPEMAQKAFEAGARALVCKSEAETELVAAVRAVMNDKLYFPFAISAALRRGPDAKAVTPGPRLSGREAEILQLIAEGKSNKEAAALLNVSRRTVENHRARIMQKLGLGSLSELVRYAVRHNIVAA